MSPKTRAVREAARPSSEEAQSTAPKIHSVGPPKRVLEKLITTSSARGERAVFHGAPRYLNRPPKKPEPEVAREEASPISGSGRSALRMSVTCTFSLGARKDVQFI